MIIPSTEIGNCAARHVGSPWRSANSNMWAKDTVAALSASTTTAVIVIQWGQRGDLMPHHHHSRLGAAMALGNTGGQTGPAGVMLPGCSDREVALPSPHLRTAATGWSCEGSSWTAIPYAFGDGGPQPGSPPTACAATDGHGRLLV
ncbi:hypothetical protein GCM10023224_45360 [Streptomonospora halophila]|uniref:Uncharacterized protein n=1 Tax=Streptomonospora halophila TaxID=427369 RepID=A0ABP9GWH5_9ACTN